MTLDNFKKEAAQRGNYYDNSQSAGMEWARSWGLTYWRLVWFYKEYKVGGMVYRSGRWQGRHGGRRITECEINGERVSEYRFKKTLETFVAPAPTAEELLRKAAQEEQLQHELAKTYHPYRRRSARRKNINDSRQLCFAF